MVAISLALYVILIIYASPLRDLIAEKFECFSSWKEPPVFERKLTTLSSSVGEGLKKRFTFKKIEMEA
jgi:hypothetical protein